MAMYMLNQSDINHFSQMFEMAEIINKSYNYLYELECLSKKNSDEYKTTIESIKKAVDAENKLYDSKRMPAELCKAYMALILQTKIPKSFPSNMESIATLNDISMNARRVLTKLQIRLMNDTEAMTQMLPNGLREMLNSLGADDVDTLLKKGIPSSTKIQQSLERDTYFLFLSYIEEMQGIPALANLKQHLLKTKYMTAFTIPDIESSMISSYFTVEQSVGINSRAVADMYRVEDEIYRTVKNLFGIEIANAQLNRLLEISDLDYSDQNKNVEAILRQSILRAILFLVGSDVVENLEDDFNKHTSAVEYEAECLNSPKRISEAMIKEAFNKLPKDKAKHFIISFNPNSTF